MSVFVFAQAVLLVSVLPVESAVKYAPYVELVRLLFVKLLPVAPLE